MLAKQATPPPTRLVQQCNPGCVDSEGAEGLDVFYWSQFSAPPSVAAAIQASGPDRLLQQQRRLPGASGPKVALHSRNQQHYYMELEENALQLLGTSDASSQHLFSSGKAF